MYGTGDTRIEGVDGPQNLERSFRVDDRIFQQGRFIRSELILGVARTGIPCGRYNRLVVLDLAILNNDPMRQQSAWCFMDTDTFLFAFREGRRIEDFQIAAADIVNQQLSMLQGQIGHQ